MVNLRTQGAPRQLCKSEKYALLVKEILKLYIITEFIEPTSLAML